MSKHGNIEMHGGTGLKKKKKSKRRRLSFMIKRYLNGNLKFNYRFLFYYSDLIIELILVRIFNILYFLLNDKI